MWLVVDDMRDLGGDVIARNDKAARALLGGVGYVFEGICLDHDLGSEETGYDVLMWALEAEVLPGKVQIVSMNPAGRDRMRQALLNAGYVQNETLLYVHKERELKYLAREESLRIIGEHEES